MCRGPCVYKYTCIREYYTTNERNRGKVPCARVACSDTFLDAFLCLREAGSQMSAAVPSFPVGRLYPPFKSSTPGKADHPPPAVGSGLLCVPPDKFILTQASQFHGVDPVTLCSYQPGTNAHYPSRRCLFQARQDALLPAASILRAALLSMDLPFWSVPMNLTCDYTRWVWLVMCLASSCSIFRANSHCTTLRYFIHFSA